LPTPLAWLATTLFVLAGWVIFRAPNFTNAVGLLRSMIGLNGFGGRFDEVGLMAVGMLLSALLPSAHAIKDRLEPKPAIAIATGLLAAWCFLKVGKGAPLNFIYFQF
jgi:hypothetical protein